MYESILQFALSNLYTFDARILTESKPNKARGDSEKEEEHHRSMWCRLRCQMTSWVSSYMVAGEGFACIFCREAWRQENGAGDVQKNKVFTSVRTGS